MEFLDRLRAANIKRQAEWPGNEKITLSFRGLELAGEAGELCNLLKKFIRLEMGIHGTEEAKAQLRAQIEEEIGDVLICLDLIGIDCKHGVHEVGTHPMTVPDPSTHAYDIAEAGNWLAYCVGEISIAAGHSGLPVEPSELSHAYQALLDVGSCFRVDVHKAAQIKFNMTTREQGLTTLLEGDTYK